MKRFLLLPLALSGCLTTSIWYKEGHAPASSSNDHTDCSVEALQKVPPSNQTFSTPTYTTPTYVNCSPYTTGCTVSGGDVYGGQIYTKDVNAGLRHKVLQQCMAGRGWQIVDLPSCGLKAYNAFSENPSAHAKARRLTPESCAIYHQDDWYIYNP